MNTVTSKDGTTIAFDRMGEGPPVILVCGGSVDRTADARIAEELASDFTVFNYDRRGRGDSGDTLPYAIEREVEDIHAVVEEAGGAANLWGSSSGAVLALIAAGSGLPITKLALWEPPFIPEGYPRPPDDQVAQYERMVAEGRRGDAAEYFMTKVVGMPAEFVAKAATVVAVAGSARSHARVRREDHGRLHGPDRARGFREGSHHRHRGRRRHPVDARDRDDVGGRAPRGTGSVPGRPGPRRRPEGAGSGPEGVLRLRFEPIRAHAGKCLLFSLAWRLTDPIVTRRHRAASRS